jgi:magnesium-transporting ATPase (P-type)
MQRFMLAGCHSLVQLNSTSTSQAQGSVVGDPLDLAALQYSGWKYNQSVNCYECTNTKSCLDSDPIKLWQIKTFPFDANKRMSSAVVLAQLADKSYRVWALIKGSPESLQPLYQHRHDHQFLLGYKKRIQQLEAQGYRTIALGAQDLTNSTELVEQLFPNGLSSKKKALRGARIEGSSLHRNDFEGNSESGDVGLHFFGFACFDTTIRSSSQRVIGELRRGGIQVIMLTGDAIDAALSVALKVNLIQESSVAILETEEDSSGTQSLIWQIVELRAGKGGTRKALHQEAKTKRVTKSTVNDILNRQGRGDCSIAATGRAVELLLAQSDNGASGKVKNTLADNLFRISIIARATPVLKKSVITCLKGRCEKKVIMCGKYQSYIFVVIETNKTDFSFVITFVL